jgi:GWxTD domain-containing protein
MTLALANYRIKPGKEARPAFDAALARLEPKARDHLDRFERVLSPRDSAAYVRYDSTTRANIASASWLLADPLWSTPQADPRVEFLARITFAELRWSVPEQHAPGADTERGKIFIRYGPPSKKLGYQPQTGQVMFEFWMYNADLVFAFMKMLHTGKAFTAPGDDDIVYRVEQWQPARWDNIASSRIDSMPTQVARFRAGVDSVDVFLATHAPLDAMRSVAASNAQALARLWLYSRNSPGAFIDSVSVAESGDLRWTRRVQNGPYYYRVESNIPGVLVAGRTTATMMMGPDSTTGFTTRGFGLSDIVLASHATSANAPRRWTDFEMTPLLGSVARRSEIALVWETYELGKQSADARYDVTITIERQRGKDGRIAAQVIGRLGSAVGSNAGKNKVELHFERTAPYSDALADNVSLALGDTPPGTYALTVQITDRVSRRVASRTTNLVIHE